MHRQRQALTRRLAPLTQAHKVATVRAETEAARTEEIEAFSLHVYSRQQ